MSLLVARVRRGAPGDGGDAGRADEDRRGWALLALAVGSWMAGDILHGAGDPTIAGLPVSDVLWLGCYAAVYAGLALLTRRLLMRAQATVWLDGASLGLAVAAGAAALLIAGVLHVIDRPASEIVVNLSYPLLDVALAGMALGAWAVTGWRPPPAWRWLLAAVLLMLAGDVAYFVAWGTHGYAYGSGAALEAAWALAFLLMAIAAWQPEPSADTREPRLWTITVLPGAVTLVATALLACDRLTDDSPIVIGLCCAALVAVGVRSALCVRELRSLALTRREALTDELTGLANRRALMRALRAACRPDGPPAALLLCDLDGFKEFNDTLGHEAGDDLLREAAARVARALGDDAFVARLGGDEFALLAEGAGREAAVALAGRLLCALSEPLPVAGIGVRLEASIGIALSPDHTRDAAGLLRRADVAMYAAKAGHAGVELYDADRDEHSRERLELAGRLRDAVEAGELELHYQPKVEIATGRVVGAEALVRWRHPQHGLLFPDAFLPAAEHAGLMRPLTLAVLDEALAACGRWAAAGRVLGVAVNLSPSNLLDAELPAQVAARLAAHGVDPAQLTLEVTEGTILANPLRSGEVLATVRSLGVAVSLDDFGTGHSSLSHVKRLPVDELKIDRSFVGELAADPTDRAIVEAILHLASSLGLTVTAEGVEDDEVLGLLCARGCELAQGYLYSRPLPEDGFTAWLSARDVTLDRPRRAPVRARLEP